MGYKLLLAEVPRSLCAEIAVEITPPRRSVESLSWAFGGISAWASPYRTRFDYLELIRYHACIDH